METALKIALSLAAILGLIAGMRDLGVFDQVFGAMQDVLNYLPSLVQNIAPYISTGRALMNMVIGFPSLVDAMLWFTFMAPISLGALKITVFIFNQLLG